MLKKHPLLVIFISAALLVSACAPTPPPYVPIETIVAATYAAISAQTEAARPPNTPTPLPPTPTRPVGTATATPTATFVLASITPTFTPSSTPEPTATTLVSGSGNLSYSCIILSSSPTSVSRVKTGSEIQWALQIENSGTSRWDPKDVEVRFSGGTNLASKKAFEISGPAKPGQNITIKIKLNAPKEPGVYTTTWVLKKGIHQFCNMDLEIEAYK